MRPHSVSVSNLRSRGDGPDHEKDDADSVSKPPLTRRWTCLACLRGPAVRQTSAHVGMNLKCTTLTVGEYAKPRSRGDEPSVVVQYSADDGKTPLTRRWTYSMMLLMPKNHQTSAHAEMDPTRRWPEPSRQANLRSRGDGPGRADGACPQRSKPPHTRRWAPKSDGRTCGLTLRTYPPVVVSYDSSLNVDVGNRCPWQRKWIRNRGQLSQAHFCELLADV